MSLILVVIILFLLFGGGGYYGYRRQSSEAGASACSLSCSLFFSSSSSLVGHTWAICAEHLAALQNPPPMPAAGRALEGASVTLYAALDVHG